MLERVLVALLVGGHVLLEGVPGLAKTLTVKTLARGGERLVQARAVHARPRAGRPRRHAHLPARTRGRFDVELGPVLCNFLLADEINRAPAKVQSALLEVMQEHQVTIGGETLRGAGAVPRARDPEPDRVRGHLPAARGADGPLPDEDPRGLPVARARRRRRGAAPRGAARGERAAERRRPARLPRATAANVFVDARGDPLRGHARRRHPPPGRATGSTSSSATSSTAPARAGRSASCSRRARSRCCAAARHAVAADVRDLARDVLRHRLVLSYEALSDGVTPDDLLRPGARGGRARRRRDRARAGRGGAAA